MVQDLGHRQAFHTRLAHGLVKGSYLSTEALGSGLVGLVKAIVFRRFDALPIETVLRGLAIGSSLTVGSYVAKRFVRKIEPARFQLLMDALLFAAGSIMLTGALWG